MKEFYALHTYPAYKAGTLGIQEGPVMAAPDRFSVIVYGREIPSPRRGLCDPHQCRKYLECCPGNGGAGRRGTILYRRRPTVDPDRSAADRRIHRLSMAAQPNLTGQPDVTRSAMTRTSAKRPGKLPERWVLPYCLCPVVWRERTSANI